MLSARALAFGATVTFGGAFAGQTETMPVAVSSRGDRTRRRDRLQRGAARGLDRGPGRPSVTAGCAAAQRYDPRARGRRGTAAAACVVDAEVPAGGLTLAVTFTAPTRADPRVARARRGREVHRSRRHRRPDPVSGGRSASRGRSWTARIGRRPWRPPAGRSGSSSRTTGSPVPDRGREHSLLPAGAGPGTAGGPRQLPVTGWPGSAGRPGRPQACQLSGGQAQRVALARAWPGSQRCCCWTNRCPRWTPEPASTSRPNSNRTGRLHRAVPAGHPRPDRGALPRRPARRHRRRPNRPGRADRPPEPDLPPQLRHQTRRP